MWKTLLVFIGGGLGACLRAIVSDGLAGWSATLPVSILLINVVGAFCLGLIATLADEVRILSVDARIFLGVGVLGGFTTFSTFGWGADLLLTNPDHWGTAAIYVGTSAVGGLLAAQAGIAVARQLDRVPALASRGQPRRSKAELVVMEQDQGY